MRTKHIPLLFTLVAIFALIGCQAQPLLLPGAPAPASPAAGAPVYWPTSDWQNSTPEQQGMDSARLAAMFDAIDQKHLNMHSVLVIRNGYIVAEAYWPPYDATVKQRLASVTKSVTGMLTGIAISRGQIESTRQPVLEFFPGRTVANLDQNKRSLTLEHLLTLTDGLDCSDATGTRDRLFQSADWVQFTLDLPMAAAPGRQFTYCTPAVHLISAILQQATGKSERELANEVLFPPLGIPPVAAADWSADPQGVSEGGSGLLLTPRNMAKLGFLYLHGGRWQDKQVVPAAWVATSLTPHTTEAATGRGYGYLFWLYGDQGYASAMGLGGQDIHIIPAKNMVVVFTAAMDSSTHDQEVIQLLGDYVVPAAAGNQPLPENPTALAHLRGRISHAASPQVPVPPLPALAQKVSGRVYQMDDNPFGWTTLSLAFQAGSPEAVATINGSSKLLIGLDNVYRLTQHDDVSEAVRGHWAGADTLVIDDHIPGDMFQWQYTVTFSDDQLQVELRELVNGGATYTARGRPAP
jgi:CubicO group peptidase (beta-lactamase class C family)